MSEQVQSEGPLPLMPPLPIPPTVAVIWSLWLTQECLIMRKAEGRVLDQISA